ncbi:MAG: pyruvate formate-lyase-activating protein [Intestinimonas sp.]|nr:pyruvate formate-lyase-activating protein [Intestinimonas sp.]
MTLGRIHSLESMGLVDGPGIRTVVFLQGCRLRCRYCHNPDTWQREGGTETTPRELTDRLIRFKSYYKSSGGGVTFSGGEPLMQPDFLLETLHLCRDAGIHTCLDTAGCGLGHYDKILADTDLILYDVKHYRPDGYRQVTGHGMDETLSFVKAVRAAGTPMWVRHVVVPGLTDGEEHIRELGRYIRTLPNVEKTELLPYHLLGVSKYRGLGIPYPLEGVPAMERKTVEQYQNILDEMLGG